VDLFRLSRIFHRCEKGVTLLETVIAVSILSTVAVAFLSGISTSSKGVYISDEGATAESLARTQMEWAKNASYSYNATSYSIASIPAGRDYVNYSANITAEPLHEPDDGIQKISVTITRSGETVFRLEGYKVDR
jgi:type II secretory pathway pseudopilin PulG